MDPAGLAARGIELTRVAMQLAAARLLFTRYGDSEWLLTDPRLARGGKAGPAIYLCDVDTGRTLLLETHANALQKLSEHADIDAASHQQIRVAAAVLIGDLLGNVSGIHADTRRSVILGAAFCITETRGFHLTKHHGADVQHLLLRYLDVASGNYVLTPMPLFKAHPIAVADLNATTTHVLISEQLNFPERFVAGRPLSFKETRRNVLAGKAQLSS